MMGATETDAVNCPRGDAPSSSQTAGPRNP